LPNQVQVTIQGDDQTAAAIAQVLARLNTLKTAGGDAAGGLARNFNESRGAAALLGEEVGIKLNRHLRGILATSSLIGPALEAAFPIAAAVGFGTVMYEAGKKIYDAFTDAEGAKKRLSENQDLVKQLQVEFKEAQKLSRELQLIGAGSNAGRLALEKAFALEDSKGPQAAAEEFERYVESLQKVKDQTALVTQYTGSSAVSFEHLTAEAQKARAELPNAFLQLDLLASRAANSITKVDIATVKFTKGSAEDAAARARKLAESIQKEITEWKKLFDLQRQGAEQEAKFAITASEAIAYVTKGLEKSIPLEELQRHELEQTNKLMLERVNYLVDLGKGTEAWRDELAHLDDAIFGASHPKYEVMKTLNQSLTSSFDSMFSDIALGTRDVSQAFTSMASSIAASVLQAVAKMLILAPLLRGISSLLGAFAPTSSIPLFGGRGLPLGPADFAIGPGRAGGGPVFPGTIYPVGEKGETEWFAPSTAGTILPNGAFGGARIVNQVQVINQTGRPVSAQIGKSAFNGKAYVTQVILEDLKQNGPIRQAFGGG
jgi:hypothetical protein